MESSGADSSSTSPSPPVLRDNLDPASASASAWDDAPPLPSPPVRVKFMVSFGGRIQPRPHDTTRLSYVGGETKILAIDRSARLPALLSKLASLAPFHGPLCLKYQLPGEDLDALVSVTDDDDLDHMMVEYDRLHGASSSPKPVPRLRLFLFPVGPPPPRPSAALLDPARPYRHWFLDSLNAVPALPPPPPPPPTVVEASPSADFLFGLDAAFVPSPAVKVTADPQQPPSVLDNLPLDVPAKPDLAKDERQQQTGGEADSVAATLVSTAEIQRQIPELHGLQINENPPPPIPRNGSEETLTKVRLPELQVPRAPEKANPAPQPAASAYLLEQRGGASVGVYASLAPGRDRAVYIIPAPPGVYQGFYTAAPRMVPAEAYRDAAPPTKVVGGGGVGVMTGAEAYATATGGQLAYDSTGRVVYYPSVVPTYQTVTSVALNPVDAAGKAAKPSEMA